MEALGLPFFRTALLACFLLAGIHAYLGFHVVRRGVIFVDLALAQMAALGVALAVVLDHHDNDVLNRALKPATADYERQGKTFDTVGIALASAGGAVLATGTTLLIYDLIKKRQAARPPAPKTRKVKKVIEVEEPATSMLLTPVVSPQGVGLVGEFHF